MRISIITVCFNSANTIAETLASVAAQSHPDVEHIIIDGGSTDSTLQVIKTHGAHVAKLISEKDKGIYDAMNKGIALATGDIVGFINADDFYLGSEVLSKVAEVFASPAVDACYGDPTFFVRRLIYQQFGEFNLSYKIAADVELMMRFLEVYKIRSHYIPEVLVHMRMGGTTNNSLSNIVKQNVEVLNALKSHGLRGSAMRLVGSKFISRGRQFFARLDPVAQ